MPRGPKGERRPADTNQLAKAIVDIATGECADDAPQRGRPGGLKGGKARSDKMPPERRSDIARQAAKKRWRHE